MTVEEMAKIKINDAVKKLRAQYAEDMLSAPMTADGDETRRLTAIKAQIAHEIAIQITLEINR